MFDTYRDMKNKAILHSATGLVCRWSVLPEQVVLMISPCRSGSTVMLRVFGYAGFAAFFQPIKNALRWREMGQERPWSPPTGAGPVFIKETFGPFAAFETAFDPLAELIDAGVPIAKIRLVVLLRDPGHVWASWRSLWPETSTLELLMQSYQACLGCVATAQRLGVPVQKLDYEACVEDPAMALGGLFSSLGLPAPDAALCDWPGRPGYGTPGSGVVLPVEPAPYITPGAHTPVIESRTICQMPPRARPSATELERLANTDIPANHARLAAL